MPLGSSHKMYCLPSSLLRFILHSKHALGYLLSDKFLDFDSLRHNLQALYLLNDFSITPQTFSRMVWFGLNTKLDVINTFTNRIEHNFHF